jgi:hypothetical protein
MRTPAGSAAGPVLQAEKGEPVERHSNQSRAKIASRKKPLMPEKSRWCLEGVDGPGRIQQTLSGTAILLGRKGYLMSGNGWQGPGAGGVGQRIEEAIELIEMELRHAIKYVNDAVIPQVRRESISAMRTTADTLRNLADRFERQANQQAQGQARQYDSGQNQAPQNSSPQNSNREPRGWAQQSAQPEERRGA